MIGKSGANCLSRTKLSTVRRWCSPTDNPVFATETGSHTQVLRRRPAEASDALPVAPDRGHVRFGGSIQRPYMASLYT